MQSSSSLFGDLEYEDSEITGAEKLSEARTQFKSEDLGEDDGRLAPLEPVDPKITPQNINVPLQVPTIQTISPTIINIPSLILSSAREIRDRGQDFLFEMGYRFARVDTSDYPEDGQTAIPGKGKQRKALPVTGSTGIRGAQCARTRLHLRDAIHSAPP